MGALTEIGNLLIQTLFYLYILAVLLRLLLQQARADFYNPICQALVKATSAPLKPLRRIIPGVMGVDMASVVLALLLQMAATSLLLLINGLGMINPLFLVLWGLLGCLGMILNIYFFAILVSIVLSWIAPGSYNPAVLLLHQLTEPVMAPFRKMLPDMGGLDLSPILVFLTINILQILLRNLGLMAGLSRQTSALVIGF